jgi:hypothetical protein
MLGSDVHLYADVPAYENVIKKPMDMQAMRSKLDAAKYPDIGTFQLDAFLIVTNCCIFNTAGNFSAAMIVR